MEPNQHGLAHLNGWSSQVAGRPEHQFRKSGIVGSIFFQVYLGHLFALGDEHFRHAFKQRKSPLFAEAFLLGIDFCFRINIMGRKKLLRAGTRCSAFAVVTPVCFFGHVSPF